VKRLHLRSWTIRRYSDMASVCRGGQRAACIQRSGGHFRKIRRSILECLMALALIPGFGLTGFSATEDKYPITQAESTAFDLMQNQGQPIKAREVAETVLRGSPASFVACYVIGAVYARAEGSLPRAYYHLKKAQSLIERRWGQDVPEDGGPWLWHARILQELIRVTAEMDRYQEELDLLALHDQHYMPALTASWGWPLMKLGRMDEARAKIGEALKSESREVITQAMNTLGAIESETDHPEAASQVFRDLIQLVSRSKGDLNPTYLRNGGEAALSLIDFESAEQMLLHSSRQFEYGTYSNPWHLLAMLYIREGREPEAVEAVREMQAWSHANVASRDQQSWAERNSLAAAVLLECGYVDEALSILRRTYNQPDRRGGTSEHADQSEAGFLILYRHALKVHRQSLAEACSWAPLAERLGLWAQRAAEGIEMWVAGRRAGALIMANRRLEWSVRTTAPAFFDILEWTRIDLNEILGPGVVGRQAEELQLRRDPIGRREAPYLDLAIGYGQVMRHRYSSALAYLSRAAATLTPSEALLRAEAEALLGRAFESSGNMAQANSHYEQAMQRAPGVFRKFDLALPCRIRDDGQPLSRQTATLLSGSPRFRPNGGGFTVNLSCPGEYGVASLLGPDGTVLCEVQTRRSGDIVESAQVLSRELHRKAFAPKIDLSQTDLTSLEGSNLTGDGIREQIQELFQRKEK
jgi:tetratricopeptide (TPR) repeat protein